MANYCIEFTLDLNDQRCNNASLVLVTGNSGTPAWFSQIKAGDQVVFKLSDMTNPHSERIPRAANITITQISPSGPYASAFASPPPSQYALVAEVSPNIVSYVNPTCIYVYDFGSPAMTPLQIASAAIRFNLSIQILDQYGQPMSSHDPEIFVGGGGPPGEDRDSGASGRSE